MQRLVMRAMMAMVVKRDFGPVVNVGACEICNGELNLWEAQRFHIIPAGVVKQQLGMTQPKSAPALQSQLPNFVLGHAACNRDMDDKHLYTYRSEFLSQEREIQVLARCKLGLLLLVCYAIPWLPDAIRMQSPGRFFSQ